MTTNPTNLPYAVYRCDRIELGGPCENSRFINEQFISGHLTAMEAFEEARRLKADDRSRCYTVGEA